MLSIDIPRLMEMLPTSDVRTKAEREVAALLHAPSPLHFDNGSNHQQLPSHLCDITSHQELEEVLSIGIPSLMIMLLPR